MVGWGDARASTNSRRRRRPARCYARDAGGPARGPGLEGQRAWEVEGHRWAEAGHGGGAGTGRVCPTEGGSAVDGEGGPDRLLARGGRQRGGGRRRPSAGRGRGIVECRGSRAGARRRPATAPATGSRWAIDEVARASRRSAGGPLSTCSSAERPRVERRPRARQKPSAARASAPRSPRRDQRVVHVAGADDRSQVELVAVAPNGSPTVEPLWWSRTSGGLAGSRGGGAPPRSGDLVLLLLRRGLLEDLVGGACPCRGHRGAARAARCRPSSPTCTRRHAPCALVSSRSAAPRDAPCSQDASSAAPARRAEVATAGPRKVERKAIAIAPQVHPPGSVAARRRGRDRAATRAGGARQAVRRAAAQQAASGRRWAGPEPGRCSGAAETSNAENSRG